MISDFFSSPEFKEAWEIFKTQFPLAVWETVYVTVVSTFFAILIGLPLGVLLVVGEKGGVRPIPGFILKLLNALINLFSVSALIGTVVGTTPSIVPLVLAAFPFVARLAESSLREVSPNTVEMAQSMGASPFKIITKVLIPESVPSLISNATIAVTTVLGYSAMSGIIGGGGLGKIAINYGYYRYKYIVMIFAVVLLILIVQLFQSVGTKLAKKTDKRLKG